MAGQTLLVGYRAADISPDIVQGDVTCYVLDVYDRHAIEKTHHLKAICAPSVPEGPWDVVKYRTGPKLMSGELSLDLLQQIHLVSRKCGCRVEVDYVGRERDRNDLLDKIKDDPDRVRSFRATWPASVPGGPKLTFASYPGCFCHRRMDEGGLALAEVVCRRMCECEPPSKPPRVLDMGCGCGLVGLLVATRLREAGREVSLVMVDSHSRAVQAASENAESFGVPAEVILSDCGVPERMDGTFDVFVGNPPYYSDYRIADVFLETAKRALAPGGVCWTVCKNAAGLEPVQRRYFPSVETTMRRGYAVLMSGQPAKQ